MDNDYVEAVERIKNNIRIIKKDEEYIKARKRENFESLSRLLARCDHKLPTGESTLKPYALNDYMVCSICESLFLEENEKHASKN